MYGISNLDIDTLGYFLDRALNAMIRKLNRIFNERGIDLQHAQYIILKVLWVSDGLSQSQIARILGKDPAAISRAVRYLEAKGYIERRDRNGSTNSIFLTEYADLRKREIEEVADTVTAEALRGMPASRYGEIKQLLTTVYNNSK